MPRDHHPDPMTGQTFEGVSGSPTAGMPEPPPIPGEGGSRTRMIGAAVMIVLLLIVLAAIVF